MILMSTLVSVLCLPLPSLQLLISTNFFLLLVCVFLIIALDVDHSHNEAYINSLVK